MLLGHVGARAHAKAIAELCEDPDVDVRQRLGEVVPLSSGKILASEIPGAEFVELDSANHILLRDEPAWRRFREAVLDFTGVAVPAERATEEPAFAALSPREREVLGLISEGLANAEIDRDRSSVRAP